MNEIPSIPYGVFLRYVPTTPEPARRTATDIQHGFSDEAFHLDLSDRASMLAELADVNEAVTDRIARLRDEIAAGSYETPDKIRVTADRLLAELH